MRCVTEWRDTDRERAPGWGDGEAGSWMWIDAHVRHRFTDRREVNDPRDAQAHGSCVMQGSRLKGTSSKSKRSSLLSFDLRDFIRSPKHLTEHHSLTAVHSETLSPCHVHSIESCRVCLSAPPPAESLSSPAPGPRSFKASCDSRRQLRCGRGHLRRLLHAGVRVQAGCAAASMASVMAAASRAWARAASQLTAATKQSCNARLRPDGVVLLAAHRPVVI